MIIGEANDIRMSDIIADIENFILDYYVDFSATDGISR